MEATKVNITLPLDFDQIVNLVNQLPYKEKLKLREFLKKDTRQDTIKEKIQTHFASEKALARDWLLPEEDEAWKDL